MREGKRKGRGEKERYVLFMAVKVLARCCVVEQGE
jgi:hypothetical protein